MELETLFGFGFYKYAAPDGAPAGRALLPQRLFDLGGGAPSRYQIPTGFKSIIGGLGESFFMLLNENEKQLMMRRCGLG